MIAPVRDPNVSSLPTNYCHTNIVTKPISFLVRLFSVVIYSRRLHFRTILNAESEYISLDSRSYGLLQIVGAALAANR